MLLLVCALLPAALGSLTHFMDMDGRKQRAIYATAVTCLASALCGFVIFSGGDEAIELFRLSDEFVCRLRLDGAGKIYLGVAALLWPFSTLYAVEYMRSEEREGGFFVWYNVAYSAVILLAAASNLFTLYIFYELLTMATVPLVWHKKDGESTKAAVQYMLFLIGGAALGFIAVMLVPLAGGKDGAFALHGNQSLQVLQAGYSLGGAGGDPAFFHAYPIMQWIVLLGFLGFGVKAAVLPLCRWLPKASVAPTPVTALLHAVAVVNAGVFAVLRVLYYEVPTAYIRGAWVQTVMLMLSAATLLYAAMMAVREQQLKKRLAWSTVSNLSYMLFGLSLLTENGMTAGLAHMVFHSLMKSVLFFCAGAVLVRTGRTQVRQMRGLGRKMPFVFGCFTLAGLSLVGVPPLPGFVSKYALVTAAFEEGGMLSLIGATALLLAAVLTAIYVLTVVYPAFFMDDRPAEGEKAPRDPGPCMRVSLIALCLLLLLAGVFAGRIMAYLTDLAKGVFS